MFLKKISEYRSFSRKTPERTLAALMFITLVLAACQSAPAAQAEVSAPEVSETLVVETAVPTVAPSPTVGDEGAVVTDGEPVILLGGNDEVGSFLTGANGMTLYIFTRDEPDLSNCYDKCAENWPPLLLEAGQALVPGDGVTGQLGVTARTDGSQQITYNGMPLYYWVEDAAVGDITGHGVGSVWAIAGVDMLPYGVIPGESKVSYEVAETFLRDNRFAVTVGVTEQVVGKVYLDLSNPRLAWVGPISVDISQFASDSQRRDDKIRTDFLQSSQYPMATFAPKQIEGLPENYTPGQEVALTISGDLTVREVIQPVTFEALVMVDDGGLTGQASTTILMSDFGVGPISILGMLETEDEVLVTFDLVARP